MKFVFALLLCLFLSFRVFAGEAFVEGMEGVPLPNDAKQMPSENFAFGNDDTQLVEVYFQKSGNFAQILNFYRDSMPQLGWQKQNESSENMVFKRGAEELTIALESANPLTVRLTLTGRPE